MFYPDGTYRFNGLSLDFSNGVSFESSEGVTIRNDISPAPVVVHDDAGNLIGLQQNHLEEDWQTLGEEAPIRSGSLVSPPLSAAPLATRADLLAHWYNDFGTEYRRTTGRRSGWIGWYYWTWNFHRDQRDGYDPARHPLLGFYRGDDPTVLDWQCYWLREYGVSGVLLCHGTGSLAPLSGWEDPGHPGHWLWQLFHQVPNFRKLRYVMYVPTPWLKCTAENQRQLEAAWIAVLDTVYRRYPNAYVLERDGKRYPVVFLWAEQAVRGVFDNYRGARNQLAFYARIGERFRQAGWDGVALFARQPTSARMLDREELLQRGVVHMQAFYGTLHGLSDTYPASVANFAPPTAPDTVLSVVTAHHTHTPHPSKWNCPGHSPELFEELLRKAVGHIEAHNLPRVITCYNVAEWAEGGPGLQPNMQDRFGYLEAVRNVLVRAPAVGALNRLPPAGSGQRGGRAILRSGRASVSAVSRPQSRPSRSGRY